MPGKLYNNLWYPRMGNMQDFWDINCTLERLALNTWWYVSADHMVVAG